MADDKVTESRPVEPIKVAVIATGDATKLPSETVAVTPNPHEPNIVVKAVPPIVAVLIRFANLYIMSLLGFLSLRMVPPGGNQVVEAIQAVDLYHLILTAGSVALAPSVLGMLKDFTTILTGLEKKYPLSTGSI